MDASAFRQLCDPLYGLVNVDMFFADLMSQPELQRLRYVRLSNINSELLAGSANISRFEHSLGTAYLGVLVGKHLELNQRDERALVCAAMLHDVTITPFGHLMEEAFRYAGVPFEHESRLREIFDGAELGNVDRQVFRGRTLGFRRVLAQSAHRALGLDSRCVFEIIQGKGSLGGVLNSAVDIDNIDNVCRMAWHIGLPFRRELAFDLARAFVFSGPCICLDASCEELVDEWLDLRFRLYSVLMTNPLDFVAKAMLLESIRIAITGTSDHGAILSSSDWSLTDDELLRCLRDYEPTAGIVRRFELGDLYDAIGLYWLRSAAGESAASTAVSESIRLRAALAKASGTEMADLLVYAIPDKRRRLITNIAAPHRATAMARPLGAAPRDILLGIAVARRAAGTRVREQCEAVLTADYGADRVERCDPSRHLAEAFAAARPHALTLF